MYQDATGVRELCRRRSRRRPEREGDKRALSRRSGSERRRSRRSRTPPERSVARNAGRRYSRTGALWQWEARQALLWRLSRWSASPDESLECLTDHAELTRERSGEPALGRWSSGLALATVWSVNVNAWLGGAAGRSVVVTLAQGIEDCWSGGVSEFVRVRGSRSWGLGWDGWGECDGALSELECSLGGVGGGGEGIEGEQLEDGAAGVRRGTWEGQWRGRKSLGFGVGRGARGGMVWGGVRRH
ncbi:hypothetical protein M758_3G231300 [Ceratodon purpureus]|nr:hypothetical protein M758_3G231300 [Ceratodon purpureus]